MSESNITGIVLRRWDAGESDRKLSLLTQEQGRMEVIAKGARKGNSRLAGVTEPLSVCTFAIAEGKHRSFITQAQPLTSFPGLRNDYSRLTMALSFAEVLHSFAQINQVNAELFQHAWIALKALELHEKPLVALLWAELVVMSIEGILPSFDHCVLDGHRLTENPAWISAMAGGHIDSAHSNEFSDRQLVDAEILIGLSKLSKLDRPPVAFKSAVASFGVLSAFWYQHAHKSLPAREALTHHLTELA